MKAVVIAAGLGNRLGDLTSDRPKALVQAHGRELILHVMDFLDAGDFSERVVVTGYQAEPFARFLEKRRPDVTVLHNPAFDKGSIRTLEVALPHLDDDFVLLNVDHLYPKRMLTAIMERRRGLMAICDFDRPLSADDMKVKLGGDDRLGAISKTLEEFDGGYIGMTWCSRDMLDTYREAARRTRKRFGENANVEAILGLLAEERAPVEIFDASGIRWLEIDTQDDLHCAAEVLCNNPDFLT